MSVIAWLPENQAMTDAVRNSASSVETPPNAAWLTRGLVISRAVYVAAKLGIPDLLADGPKTVQELAHLTKSHAPSLRRILRLLAALSVFVDREPDSFELAPTGELFKTGVPGSLRDMALLTDSAGGLRPYDHLIDAVREGKAAFEFAHGMGIFEFLANRPYESDAFNAAMAERTTALAPTVAANYGFGNARIIDIGGSQGTMLSAILLANPDATGVVFDLPNVIVGAEPRLAAAGVLHRCEMRGGDFFGSVPEGGDYYIMANVLHDWDDERASIILRNCRHAMPKHAKVLVIERAISADLTKSLPTLLADITMMIISGGKERTNNEYVELFAQAGLRLSRTIPVLAPYAIFEACQT